MFKKVREVELKEYNGVGYLYRHEESSMEVFHIKNDSKELTCNFMFATPSTDDTGVAHILEHTVLCGSKRFPVKDPFSQVYLSSPNTFLNAMTFNDKTMYPFSSPLKKDFDILFDIYADAVFEPLLRKQSFEQEGVRFYSDVIDGVVYNEMTGALSSADDIAQSTCMRDLYKGTPFMYESGGDPKYIADLTYQAYKDHYYLWYSPSNCRLFMYGDLDITMYLNKLEERYLYKENLSKWKAVKLIPNNKNYPVTCNKPIYKTETCPQQDSNDVILTWLTKPSEDHFEILTLTVLVDILLGNPGAPLYKAITDSSLGEDLHPISGTDPDFSLMPFMVGFTGAKKNSEKEIENFILKTLKDIATNGIDPYQVKGAIKRQEFRIQEITGGSEPYGFAVSLKCARSWLRGNNPEDGLLNIRDLNRLKKEVAKGRYFENWIMTNIVNNPTRCLLNVVYDPLYNDKLNGILKEKLVKRSSEFAESEKKEFEDFIAKEDSEEDLATIPRISISDMPCEIPSYERTERLSRQAKILQYPLYTRNIVYLNLAFSTLSLNEEEKSLLPLLIRLMQMTGTDKYDYVTLGSQIKNLTGSFIMTNSSSSTIDEDITSDVIVMTKMLEEDTKDALDLVSDILNKSDVLDEKRILASVTDMLTEFEENYAYSGSSYANLYASSRLSICAKETDMSIGTRCWLYLKEHSFNKVSLLLKQLKDKVFTQKNMLCQIGCEQKFMDKANSLIDDFVSTFPIGEDKIISDFYSKKPENNNKRSLLALSSGPSYNSAVTYLDGFNQKDLTLSLLLCSTLSNGYLWNVIRGQNGAYGVNCTVDMQEKLCSLTSYRDPQLDNTYDVFSKAFDQDVSDKELEYSIVSIIGRELRPLTPQQKCNESFKRYRYKMDNQLYLERRQSLLNATVKDVKEIAKRIKKAFESQCCQASVCSTGTCDKQDSEKTEKIILPI